MCVISFTFLYIENLIVLKGLDTPFLLYFPRIIKRTVLRLLGLEPLCAPGCGETFRSVFLSKDSILWFALTNHFSIKKRLQERLKEDSIAKGGKLRRIGGWGSQLAVWKESVRRMVQVEDETN